MCPVQTTYSTEHAPAYEGMKATTSGLFNTRSYFAEGGNILPGRAVVPGTDGEKQCTLPSAGSVSDDFLGLTLYELNRVHNSSNQAENQDRPLSIVNTGEIWVIAQDGCSVNDSVFVVVNTAGGNPLGSLRSTDDAANSVPLNNAKFITAAAAGGLAKISLNAL